METQRRNYWPILLVIVVLNVLFIGGALVYFNRQNVFKTSTSVPVQTERLFPTEGFATQKSSLDPKAKEEVEALAESAEWEIVEVNEETVLFTNGEEELSLTQDMFVVEGERELKKGLKVELSRPVVGEPIKVRVLE